MMSGEPARWPVRRVRSETLDYAEPRSPRDDSSGDTLIRDPNQVILGRFDVLRGCESFGWGIPNRARRSYDSEMDDTLFDLPPTEVSQTEPEVRDRPRVQRPRRNQVVLRPSDLESLLPEDHRARLVWAFVERLDLDPLYGRIRAVEHHSGRPPIDPAILTALWLYATLEGVGSARALETTPAPRPTAPPTTVLVTRPAHESNDPCRFNRGRVMAQR
jgi:hypothetical protein